MLVQGNKYGCEMTDAGPLLMLASSLGIRVSGVSFHVGSGAMSPEAFSAAIHKARQVVTVPPLHLSRGCKVKDKYW